MALYNPFSLQGKTILVTGASSGIGRVTAVECSKMGATMIITGRDSERLKETFSHLTGEGHQQIIADLANDEGIDFLVSSLSQIDGAVLCSGINMTVPIQFATRKKFDKIFNINFFSQTELSRLLFKKKVFKHGSSLIFLSSEGGTIAFNYGNGIYGASKAAINSFMQFCANEFATRHIRVNSISPGMIETPMISSMSITEEQLEAYKKRYLLRRFGVPEDIAYAAIYLLSDASSWVTASTLVINGGGVSINS